jgi:hypothetical protein
MSFGLFAPHNLTVVATLLVCAISVSGAIFLIVELDRPFEGLIRIPSARFKMLWHSSGSRRLLISMRHA